jgi:predicted permease
VALGGAPLAASATTGVAVVGRTHQRSARAAVEGSLSGIARGFAAADGREAHPGVRLESIGSGPTNSADRRVFALVLASVFTVIGLVLIVGCINVANLLLASAVARRAEVGLRLALGASRARLARQLLTESLSLGLLSGAIALVLTMWLVPILARLAGAPSSIDTTPDLRVYAFLFVVSLAAGLGAGFAPARHAAGDALASPLKGSGASGREAQPSSRLRPALVGVQAATSLVLVVLAALLTRGMIRATQVDVGFDAARLLTVVPSFPRGAYDVAGAQAYWNIVLERVRALPGVQAAALTSHPPFGSGNRVTIFNRGGNRYTILHHDANAEYFTTLGLRTVRGRTFTADEVRAQAPVAVITESMAREFFPAADPIGQPLDRIGVEADPAVVIVGVVSDAITARLRELGAASIYRPMTDTRDARLMIRADSPAALVAPVRSALHAIDPRVRLDIAPISDSLRRQLDEPRTLASMAATLALLALLLAVVGIYGVTAFVVGQRTHELGVRVALGATTTDVRRLLVLDSLRPIGYGLAGGVVASLLAGRVLRGTLYGIGAADPIAFGAAIALLLIVALGAVLLPTRRAAAVDPSSLLRQL